MVVTEFLATLGLDVNAASFTKGVAAFELIRKASGVFYEQVIKLTKALPAMVDEVAQTSDMLDETSQKTGIATDTLQELGYAAQFSGIGTESLAQSVGLLAKNMVAASKGGKEAQEALKGIDYKNADGSLKATDDVLAQIADKFKNMPDGAEKTALAMKLFGRAGKDMIPFLNAGAGGIEELKKEARELGIVLDEALIKQGVELADTQDKLKSAWKGVRYQIGSALLPDVLKLSKAMLDWWKVNKDLVKTKIAEWLQKIKNFGQQVWLVIKGLYPMFRDLAYYLSTGVGQKIAAALALIFSPLARATAMFTALALVVEDFVGWLNGKDSAFGDLVGTSFEDFKNEIFGEPSADEPWWMTLMRTFGGIISDLPKAFDEAIAYWTQKFTEFFDWIAKKWQGLTDIINDAVGFLAGSPDDSFIGRVQRAQGQQVNAPGVYNLGNVVRDNLQGQAQIFKGEIKEINVYAAPGMNEKDLTGQVQKQVAENITTIMAHTYASIAKGKR